MFLAGALWVIAARSAAAHAGAGLATQFGSDAYQPPLSAAFLVFLLLTGFSAIHWLAIRNASLRQVNALPARQGAGGEWSLGAAIGWGLAVVAVLPMFFARALHPAFWLLPRAAGLSLVSLLTLLLLTLAQEAVFRGYLFARLIRATSPTLATLLMSCLYATVASFHPESTRLSVLVAFLMSLLFSLAWFRTHALWLPWGLHFAWSASIGVLFGLPLAGLRYDGVVDTVAHGPAWLTGGGNGPEGALATAVVLLAGMAILYALTRELAWAHTHPVIFPAGYPMDVAPPAEHTRIEQAATASAPLVQILSSTPDTPSTLPAIDAHLRSTPEDR